MDWIQLMVTNQTTHSFSNSLQLSFIMFSSSMQDCPIPGYPPGRVGEDGVDVGGMVAI